MENQANKSLIDTRNINQKVYHLLKNRIITREYPPGYKLNILDLQKEFGVSNSPIKAAFYRLAGEDFIEITSRKGTFVKDITPYDILEIEQARIVIETGAVEIVALNISDSELEKLEAIYQDTLMKGKKFDYIAFMKKDFAFHGEIIRLTRNERLIRMYERLNTHLQIARCHFARNINKRLPWTDTDHLEILQHLYARNPQKAKEVIVRHITKAKDALVEVDDKGAWFSDGKRPFV